VYPPVIAGVPVELPEETADAAAIPAREDGAGAAPLPSTFTRMVEEDSSLTATLVALRVAQVGQGGSEPMESPGVRPAIAACVAVRVPLASEGAVAETVGLVAWVDGEVVVGGEGMAAAVMQVLPAAYLS